MIDTRVDPDALKALLQVVTDGDTREQTRAVVEKVRLCLVGLGEVDLSELERQANGTPTAALWSGIEARATRLWDTVGELRRAMVPLVDRYEAQGKKLEPVPLRLCENAWAMSFVVWGEAQEFRKRLPALLAVPEGWELVNALQEHFDRLRSALLAVLTGVHASLPVVQPEQEDDSQVMELLATRELRSRVFELRDGVLAVETKLQSEAPQLWQEYLVQVKDRLNEFVFGPAFGWMRAADKRSFLLQRQTLGDILGLWSPIRAEPARHAVIGLARFLEALEEINKRECLVVHDRAALKSVVENIEKAQRGGKPRDAMAGALAALSEAQGRDKQLDELLAQSMAPGSPVAVESILSRAREVLAGLGG